MRGMRIAGLWMLPALAACQAEPASIQVKLPVEAYVSSVSAPPPAATFHDRGEKVALRACAFNERGGYLGSVKANWSSNNPAVAAVDGDGVVTINGSGEAVISAQTLGAKPLTSNLALHAAIVSSIRIIPPKPDFKRLRVNDKAQLRAEALDEHGAVIPDAHLHWGTSDHGCWVMQNGEIEGAMAGDTAVTVEADHVAARFDLTVFE